VIRWGRVVVKEKLTKEGIPKYFKPHPPTVISEENRQPISKNNQVTRAMNQDTCTVNQDACVVNKDARARNKDTRARNQDTHVKNQDTHSKNQDTHPKNQDTHSKNQDTHFKNQDGCKMQVTRKDDHKKMAAQEAQGCPKSQDTSSVKKPLSTANGVENLTHKAADLSISAKQLKSLSLRQQVEVRRSPRIRAKRVRSVSDEVSWVCCSPVVRFP
jgi:hypothetical protein